MSNGAHIRASGARAEPRERGKPDHGWSIAFCIGVLATVVLPWTTQAGPRGTLAWSWDVLPEFPWQAVAYTIGCWAAAMAILIAAATFRPRPFALVLTVAPMATIAFLLLWLVTPGSRSLARLVETLGSGRGLQVVWVTSQMVCLLACFVASDIRFRAGPTRPVRVVQGIAGGGLLLTSGYQFVELLRCLIRTLRGPVSNPTSVPDPGLRITVIIGGSLLVVLLLALAGGVAVYHAIWRRKHARGVARLATLMIQLGLASSLLIAVSSFGILGRAPMLLIAGVALILAFSMPVLMCMGLSRLISGTIRASRAAVASAPPAATLAPPSGE